MTSFVTRSMPDYNGAYVHEIIVTTDNQKHYEYIQKAARFCVDNMKPMTNADHIRSMTDDELAELLSKPWCENHRFPEECEQFDTDCEACVLDWLKQPYKEEV